jgi:broad specificity phosphatase PhoE
MKLYALRHGETRSNAEDIIQGCLMPGEPLSPMGRDQIAAAMSFLPDTASALYASPLLRATQSASLVNERYGLPVQIVDELKERDFGALSGRRKKDVEREHPEVGVFTDPARFDYHPWGGESSADLARRVMQWVDRIRTSKKDVVIAVTHHGVIRMLQELYPDAVVETTPILHGSVHEFDLA